MSQEGKGLIQRGLLLVGGIAVLALVVLWILLARPGGGETPKETVPTEWLAMFGGTGVQPFPGYVDWPAVAELPKVLPSGPGWEIRYNATLALARRGSTHLPLGTVREMLDEPKQMRNFRAPLEAGGSVPDEVAARLTILSTLKALAEWWHKLPADDRARTANEPDMRAVRQEVDQLAQSVNKVVKSEAERTRLALAQ
jgi:hypothetical protein